MFKDRLYPPKPYYILGDAGYPLTYEPIFVLTPFRDTGNVTARERRFNFYHSVIRSQVERVIGSLKIRWRCIFDSVLRVRITRVSKVILCCAALHNICVMSNDFVEMNQREEPETNRSNDASESTATQSRNQAIREREKIADEISSLCNLPEHLSDHC